MIVDDEVLGQDRADAIQIVIVHGASEFANHTGCWLVTACGFAFEQCVERGGAVGRIEVDVRDESPLFIHLLHDDEFDFESTVVAPAGPEHALQREAVARRGDGLNSFESGARAGPLF